LTHISNLDILYIEVRYIVTQYIVLQDSVGGAMNEYIKKIYVPMTESAFFILLCLQKENHGYGIVKRVEELTDGEVILAPGTMYGSLSKMEKDGIIRFVRNEDKRKIYIITDLGLKVLKTELKRIERLYHISREVPENDEEGV